jgi:uncharacterized protein YpmB
MTAHMDRIPFIRGERSLRLGDCVLYQPDGEHHHGRFVVTGIDDNGAELVIWIGHMDRVHRITDISRIGCEVVNQ